MVTMESIVYQKYFEAQRLMETFFDEGLIESANRYQTIMNAIDSIISIYETSNDLDPLRHKDY